MSHPKSTRRRARGRAPWHASALESRLDRAPTSEIFAPGVGISIGLGRLSVETTARPPTAPKVPAWWQGVRGASSWGGLGVGGRAGCGALYRGSPPELRYVSHVMACAVQQGDFRLAVCVWYPLHHACLVGCSHRTITIEAIGYTVAAAAAPTQSMFSDGNTSRP